MSFLRQLGQRLMMRLVDSRAGWRVLNGTLLASARYVMRCKQKRAATDALVAQITQRLMPDLTVRHGPFAGMRYPEPTALGSALFPKLLGSYERELADVLAVACDQPYSEVVDIGCAEGYYAIGFAMRFPRASIWAFDIDQRATALCQRMATLNGVADRFVVGSACSAETLAALPLTTRPLIICDCEGYEAALFADAPTAALRRSALLIESHDFIDITISSRLRQCFGASHVITIIPSIDDIKKAQTYIYEELAPYDLRTRRLLLGEHRPAIMEWLWMTPRVTEPTQQSIATLDA